MFSFSTIQFSKGIRFPLYTLNDHFLRAMYRQCILKVIRVYIRKDRLREIPLIAYTLFLKYKLIGSRLERMILHNKGGLNNDIFDVNWVYVLWETKKLFYGYTKLSIWILRAFRRQHTHIYSSVFIHNLSMGL